MQYQGSDMQYQRSILCLSFFSCAIWVLGATTASAVVVSFDLTRPVRTAAGGGYTNQLQFSLSDSGFLGSVSGSGAAVVDDNELYAVRLQGNIDTVANTATVTNLAFVKQSGTGIIAVNDASIGLTNGFGELERVSFSNLKGDFQTSSPVAVNGTSFSTNGSSFWLNGGQAEATGWYGGTTQVFSTDPFQSPIYNQSGSISASSLSITGNLATFTATVVTPVISSSSSSIAGTTASLSGNLRAIGTFSQILSSYPSNGVHITRGDTVLIRSASPNAWFSAGYQFADGRIAVGCNDPDTAKWSTDGGQTWQNGIAAPMFGAIELGNGEVLSMCGSRMFERADGKWDLVQDRSLNNWASFTTETAVVDIPLTVPNGADDGQVYPSFITNHDIIRLTDGRLMATMYGAYAEDTTHADGYPWEDYHCNKFRLVSVFSSDGGQTWGSPVTVATAGDLPLAYQGPCEADTVRAANGDILVVMRSGYQMGSGLSSPAYITRSSDEGQTWSDPVEIADRGVRPAALKMSNGLLVTTTGREGNFFVVSKDDGLTWEDPFFFYNEGPFPITTSYNSIFEVAPNTILVTYDRTAEGGGGYEVVGTYFTITAPEPTTMGMLATGSLTLLALAWWRKRSRRSSAD